MTSLVTSVFNFFDYKCSTLNKLFIDTPYVALLLRTRSVFINDKVGPVNFPKLFTLVCAIALFHFDVFPWQCYQGFLINRKNPFASKIMFLGRYY